MRRRSAKSPVANKLAQNSHERPSARWINPLSIIPMVPLLLPERVSRRDHGLTAMASRVVSFLRNCPFTRMVEFDEPRSKPNARTLSSTRVP
jgi:hypothetical protein